MMKTMRYVLLISVLLGILSTCDMFHKSEIDKPDDGKVRVSIQTTYTGAERSVFPDIGLNNVDHFALWGGGSGGYEEALIPSFTQNASVALNAGTWNFTVKGYNAEDVLILQGELKNQEVSSLSKSFAFSLSPLLEGTGSIAITITLPAGSGVTTIAVFKEGTETAPLTPENDRITYNAASVSVGNYFYTFRLKNNQDNTIAVVPEIVQVRAAGSKSRVLSWGFAP
jgi:hypothetical protein